MDGKRLFFGEPSTKNTDEFFWHLLWIMAVGISVSYVSYLFFGSIIIAGEKPPAPVVVIDLIKMGEHHLSGVVLIPSACHKLSVHAELVSESVYKLDFRTWQEPSRDCPRGIVPQNFETIVFAPSVGVTFVAELDGSPVPLDVLPYYD